MKELKFVSIITKTGIINLAIDLEMIIISETSIRSIFGTL